MNFSFLYPALLLLPCAFMAIFMKQRDRAHAAKAVELPIGTDEKFLRSPGESALEKKTDLDHKILESLLFIFASPPFLMVSYLCIPAVQRSSPGFGILWAIVLPIYGWLMIRAFRQWASCYDNRQNWLLGYRGERAVGEHLNRLMLNGCRVFHDFPLNGNGNLDHIVVAPSGVYAIETKTRSKRSRLKENHKIIYDGERLEFPDWIGSDDLTQAHNQADQLRRVLTNSLKNPIDVKPILTFPGWFVELATKPPHEVQVLNHKQIHSAIFETKRILSLYDIEKISAHLDRKCRTVAI